ncbi:hypothetical protein OROHE_005924 [Orobanche hederae]
MRVKLHWKYDALPLLLLAVMLDRLVLDGALLRRLKKLCFNGALYKFGTDLTMLAGMGKLDMVIGREKEMEQLIEALLKRQKSNACLVGEAGVGKTAIVEGLAIKIAQGSVPPQLIGKKIFSIDLNRVIAGTMLHGMFEERIRDVMDEARDSNGSVILFIDELHSLIKNDNPYHDVASVLKPALARGDFVCIGATTLEEYTRYIERDEALKRRFESIHVCEPSRDECIVMIKGLVHKYQIHHQVTYTKSALVSAVDLSKLYIRESLLPDKAIDLIDKAGSRAQVLGKNYITEAEIEHVVSRCTGIPVTKVSTKESQRLLQIEETLKRSVIGQDEAVSAVCVVPFSELVLESERKQSRLAVSCLRAPLGSGRQSWPKYWQKNTWAPKKQW